MDSNAEVGFRIIHLFLSDVGNLILTQRFHGAEGEKKKGGGGEERKEKRHSARYHQLSF